jgi:multidrug efflux pump
VIAVFFIPMFYYVIESLSERFGGKKPVAPAAGGAAPAGAHAPRQRD